jgi:hypothetical protein
MIADDCCQKSSNRPLAAAIVTANLFQQAMRAKAPKISIALSAGIEPVPPLNVSRDWVEETIAGRPLQTPSRGPCAGSGPD